VVLERHPDHTVGQARSTSIKPTSGIIFLERSVPLFHGQWCASGACITAGEPKKWGEILLKQGIFSSQWRLLTNVHSQSEESIPTNIGFASSNACATGAPLPMKKWYTSLEEDNARGRFDASATSLSNSMIRMPLKHHCLSLADIGEARMGEFDPRLASPCLSS